MNGLVFVAAFAFTQQTSIPGIDPISHREGLSYVVFERSRFNKFLGMITPAMQREAKVDEETAAELRNLNIKRFTSQMGKVKELQPSWPESDSEARRDLVAELKATDDKLVEKQLEDLEELLLPNQLWALMREFLRSGDPIGLLDPVVAKWIGLTEKERAEMTSRYRDSQEYLQKLRTGNVDRTKPLPKNLDQKVRRMREKIWADLPEEKLVKCFQALGFITTDENLSDFMKRYPKRSEFLEEEVPLFRIVRLRVDSEGASRK